ncbi:MAG: phage tail protein [Firmicutes bacterium]|nr:phage tail protein [Candidatus Caballimonas caccae]
MAGILSKGITLSYKASSSASTYTDLTNLQEIPELGNTAPEKIDVTVLSDSAKKSIAGLGDTAQDLGFKFLYDSDQFEDLVALDEDVSISWKVSLPDGEEATFTGTPSVKLDGVGVNSAITYTLTVSVDSLIAFGG